VQRGHSSEDIRLDVDDRVGARSGRSRSRLRRRRSRSPRPHIVDPDYFVVPPEPIKFPTCFKKFQDSKGRKGIKKHRIGGKKYSLQVVDRV